MDLLRSGVAGRNPVALLAVYHDSELQSALASTGSKNPDVVLILPGDGALVLQPADLKWSLDVASYRQISASVLDDLLAKVPRLTEDLRALISGDLADQAWATRDGFFFAPRSTQNERFLGSAENRKQEYPIEPQEVVFGDVDVYGFFEPLPGWPTARELARMDGSSRGLHFLDNADRYYHLGAGVAGALANLDRSIFDEEADPNPGDEVERLRAFLKTVSPPSTGAVIERLGGLIRQRQALVRELRELVRGAFPFREFAEQVVAIGLAGEEESEAVIRRSFGDVYRTLAEVQETEIRATGRQLRGTGLSDAAALVRLGEDRPALARRMRQRAQALLRQRQATTIAGTAEETS
jgi:hypothetical protein